MGPGIKMTLVLRCKTEWRSYETETNFDLLRIKSHLVTASSIKSTLLCYMILRLLHIVLFLQTDTGE